MPRSLLVAFWLPADIASQIALQNGEAPEDLHLTLCYCRGEDDLSEVKVSQAIAAIAEAASVHDVLTAKVAGTGRFDASEASDGKEVFYASVDSPGLDALRVSIARALENAGIPLRKDHGFAPHITLAYLTPGDPNPAERVAGLEFQIDAITVVAGDKRAATLRSVRIPLGESAMKSAVKFAEKSDHIIEGYGIPFGGPFNGKDWHGEFFSKNTDLSLDWFSERPLLYAHGMNGRIKTAVIGRVKSYALKDGGWWVRAELDKSQKYFEDVSELIGEEALYFSSGSVQHLVQTNKSTGEILRWPWIELTLTPTPANFYADLDFASVEKHCKEAGIEICAAVKSRLQPTAGRQHKTHSIKGVFESKLAERSPSVWELWNVLSYDAVGEIARAAAAGGILGAQVAVEDLVRESGEEFIERFVPVVVAQIQDYVDDGETDEHFYLRSVSLDSLINDNSHAGLPSAYHFDQVLAAVEGAVNRAKAIQDIRIKEGRMLSVSNRETLKRMYDAMGELLAISEPKATEDAGDMSEKSLKARHLALRTFELSGFSAAKEAATDGT